VAMVVGCYVGPGAQLDQRLPDLLSRNRPDSAERLLPASSATVFPADAAVPIAARGSGPRTGDPPAQHGTATAGQIIIQTALHPCGPATVPILGKRSKFGLHFQFSVACFNRS
jgi:hypothetical protein